MGNASYGDGGRAGQPNAVTWWSALAGAGLLVRSEPVVPFGYGPERFDGRGLRTAWLAPQRADPAPIYVMINPSAVEGRPQGTTAAPR
jgi:hypothetical protein